jgi:putative oxidoreductase
MSFLFESHPEKQSTGITILRIVTGIVFLMHGWQKVFTFGFGGVTGAFTHMGIPMPGVIGPLVGVLELLGGAALIVGFLTRLAALGFTADMLGAIFFVHLKHGFFAPMGVELPLMLLTAAVALLVAGAGRYAVDNNIARRQVTAPSP